VVVPALAVDRVMGTTEVVVAARVEVTMWEEVVAQPQKVGGV
jgi:hypothetical protein